VLSRFRVIVALLLWIGVSGGCSFGGPSQVVTPELPRIDWSRFMPSRDAGDPPKPGLVTLDSWNKDSLHCAARRCSNLYELVIDEPGELKVEVYAPLGRLPDFGVVLLDADAGVLARSQEPGIRPRRLQSHVERGSYVIHVYALGVQDPGLSYEVIARLSSSAPPAKKTKSEKPQGEVRAPAPPPTSAPSSPPTSPPTSPPVPTARPVLVSGGVVAEVLDVEERAGTSFVLLDAGAPHKVAVGMRGVLLDGDRTLAEIEVVEVFADGSRARVLGEIMGSIGIDTKARIDTGGRH